MRHGLLLIASFLVLLVVAACGDTASAPTTDTPSREGPAASTPKAAPAGVEAPLGALPAGSSEWNDMLRLMKQTADDPRFQQFAKEMFKNVGIENMADLNDPNKMQHAVEQMMERGAELAGGTTLELGEADFERAAKVAKEMDAAQGDEAKLMSVIQKHGISVGLDLKGALETIGGYRDRKQSGSLTDKDKANAALYEKYLPIFEPYLDRLR